MISIIMPSYCPPAEKIIETVSNILKQDAYFEILLVLQKTPVEIIEEINRNVSDSRLRIFEDDGVGISRARNIGVKQSQGEWLLFLDDDILVEDGVLARFSDKNEFEDKNGQFYYGNLYETGSKKYYLNFPLTGQDVSYFSYNRVCSVMLVVKKELFNRIGPFDERIGSGTFFGAYEEADLIIRALLLGKKISHLSFYTTYHEPAIYPVEKTVKYARGTGAFYRKYWFKGSFLLDTKLFLDLLIRVGLLLTFKKKRILWFKGFLEGFFKFGKNL